MPHNSSEKFNELVQSFANLPSIGKKTALRLAYTILENHTLALRLAHNIENAVRFIKPCQKCGNLSENELCEICSDENRDKNLLCVVQSAKDILMLEESGSFDGLYFIFDEISNELVLKLRHFISENACKELIFALTHTINSDALIFFIEEKLKDLHLHFSKIAQGIPSGVSLENVDFISLHKAMAFRTKIKE